MKFELQDTSKLRVLVVDDEPTNRKVIEEILKTHEIPSTCVGDGLEALQLTAEGLWDVILLDLHMPALSGLEVLAELRRRGSPAEIIAISADTASRTRDQYLRLGFFDFVSKPVNPGGLVSCLLRASLRKARAAA